LIERALHAVYYAFAGFQRDSVDPNPLRFVNAIIRLFQKKGFA